MEITAVPANETNYYKQDRKPSEIILHWIVGELPSADARFTTAGTKVSAHYGIGSTGNVHYFVPEKWVAYHAGNWAVNVASIGIEHAGGQLLPDGTRKKPTQKTHDTSAELLAEISKRWNIPLDRNHVKGHREIVATACPGSLDIDYIIAKAKNLINSGGDMATLHLLPNSIKCKTKVQLGLYPQTDNVNPIATIPAGTEFIFGVIVNATGKDYFGNNNWLQVTDKVSGKVGFIPEYYITWLQMSGEPADYNQVKAQNADYTNRLNSINSTSKI